LTRLVSHGVPPDFLLFVGLVIIVELTTSEAFADEMAFSVSSAVGFASLLLFGPLRAALVGFAGGLATTLVKFFADQHSGRPSGVSLVRKALFNMAAHGLAIAAAGGVYLLCGGKASEIALFTNLIPMVLAAAVVEIVNAGLVIGAVSLQTGRPMLEIWKQNVSWAIPIDVLGMVVGGGALALGYQIAGLLGLGVFCLPIALTIYAFRLYVRQTKAQMTRLEEIVTERVNELAGTGRDAKAAGPT
jgi:hypothetical protein